MSMEANLRKRRKKLGISQRRMSKMSAIPLYCIQLCEQGIAGYLLGEVDAIERVLKLRLLEIENEELSND